MALRIAAALRASRLGVALLDGLEIGEQELGVDDVDVVEGIDIAGDVNDLGIVEAADDVADGVGGADVAEELVAEAFALARAATRPAMSTNSMEVGTRDLGLMRAAIW